MSTSSSEKNRITPFGIILKVIGSVIIAVILLIGLLAFVPPLFGYTTAGIVSGSMEPEIPVGSLVIAAPVELREIRSGDIITYTSGGTLVTHRVVSNDTAVGELITKGDANDREDIMPVSYYDVVGIVKIHLPYIGSILRNISDRTGKIYMIALLIAGVALVLVGGQLKRAG